MEKDWRSVAEAINARMSELGMKQVELAERSGLSVAAVRLLQKGKARNALPRTLAALSTALGWKADHLDRVASGTADNETGGPDVRDEIERLSDELADVKRRLEVLEAAQSATD